MNVEEIIEFLSKEHFCEDCVNQDSGCTGYGCVYVNAVELIEQQQMEINHLNDLLKDSFQGHLLDVLNRKETEIESLKKINKNIRQESVHKSVYEAVQNDLINAEMNLDIMTKQNSKLKELLKMAVEDMTGKCQCCYWNEPKKGGCQTFSCNWQWQHQSEVDEVLKSEVTE